MMQDDEVALDRVARKEIKIGILSFPISGSGAVPLRNLLTIFSRLVEKVVLVSGGKGLEAIEESPHLTISRIEHRGGSDGIARVLGYMISQLKIALRVAHVGKGVSAWLFFIGADTLLLPAFAAKIRGTPVILVFAGKSSLVLRSRGDVNGRFLSILSSITCTMADRLVLYSPSLIKEYGFVRFVDKTTFAHEHIIDLTAFRPTKDLQERKKKVGFIGSLSHTKGAVRFIDAASLVRDEEIRFIIGGEGSEKGEVERRIIALGLAERVQMLGWIPHDRLPSYLNELRLLVLPSDTEGLPNIVLEAMACGTPVLVTLVGSLKDMIKDGQNGYVLEDASPATIARGIENALSDPCIYQVAERGLAEVSGLFNLDSTVQQWHQSLKPWITGVKEQQPQ